MDHMQCPQTPVLPCMLIVPNGGMSTLHVVQRCPCISSRQNSLGAVGLGSDKRVTSLPTSLFPFEPVWGSWSDQNMTAPKWLCFQVADALASSHFFHHSYCPINNCGSKPDQDLLRIGCGQYKQQQDIFILTLYTWDL